MAEENKEFRQALNDFLYRLHVGANSGNARQMDAWRQMGYDIPVAEVTGSAAEKVVKEAAQLEVVKAETTAAEPIKTEAIADPALAADEVKKSLIASTQARPGQWWDGESTANPAPGTLAKAYEYLTRSTQAQSTNKKS